MKQILFVSFLFCIFLSEINAQTGLPVGTEVYRFTCDFNGIASNSAALLVYGTGGIILRSTDNAKSWMQINLNDSLNISYVCTVGNDFYGATKTNNIIKSDDNGVTWQSIILPENIKPYKILFNNSKFYCLSDGLITVYNNKFSKLHEFVIVSDTNYYDFVITSDRLFFSAAKGIMGIINLGDNSIVYENFESEGLCENCPVPSNFQTDGSNAYFNVGLKIFKRTVSKSEPVFNTLKKAPYCIAGNDIYQLFSIYFSDNNLDSLYFFKAVQNTLSGLRINNSTNDRYISQLTFKCLAFLGNNTFIGAGKDKLIYISYDGGVNWQLVSHLGISNDYGKYFRFSGQEYCRISKYAKFTKTSDGGVTWLPQKNYLEEYITYGYGDLLNRGSSLMLDKNNGFAFIGTQISNDSNFAYTNDGCETVKMKANYVLKYSTGHYFSLTNNNCQLLIIPGDFMDQYKYTIISRLDINIEETKRTVLDSLNFLFIDNFENNKMYAVTINYRNRQLVGNNVVYKNIYYNLMSSVDTGYTWQEEMKFVGDENMSLYFRSAQKIGDNILFSNMITQPDSSYLGVIYKLNVKNKTIDSIFSKKDIYFGDASKIGKNTFIRTYRYTSKGYIEQENYLIPDLEKNPYEWLNVTPTGRYSALNSITLNDSCFIIGAYDSLMKSTVFWFAKFGQLVSVTDNPSPVSRAYLSQVFPNPATSITKARIYWDMSFDIQTAEFELVDVLGNISANSEKFRLNRINSYTGEISLNVDNIPSGVYFIRFKIGTALTAVPLVIIH